MFKKMQVYKIENVSKKNAIEVIWSKIVCLQLMVV